jgi:Rad3-related DNA helicase
MESADIVVINHHLLLTDVQVAIQKISEVGFLIDFDELIIDEAHELESVAAHIFLNQISWKRIMARFDKIHNDSGKKRHILKNIPSKEVKSIVDELAECRSKMHSLFEKLCGEFKHSKTKREKMDVLPTKRYGSDDCDLVAAGIERLCKRLNDYVALQGGLSERATKIKVWLHD